MSQEFNLNNYINHHLSNSSEWVLPFLGPVHLPSFLSLHGVMLVIASLIILFLFVGLYDKRAVVPRGITNVLEVFVIFIRDEIAIRALGREDGRKMAAFFCTLFFFILTLNLMGLIPLFATATANINVTAGLALIILGFMIFGAICKNGMKGFLQALMPPGVPGFVLIILFPIEFLGLFIKAFALTIRLFANMLAGHIIIFSLLGLVVLLGAVGLPAVFLAIFINLLEIFVAFLQAYIFTLLSAMFIGQVYHPSH